MLCKILYKAHECGRERETRLLVSRLRWALQPRKPADRKRCYYKRPIPDSTVFVFGRVSAIASRGVEGPGE